MKKSLGLKLKPYPWFPWYQRRWLHITLGILIMIAAFVVWCWPGQPMYGSWHEMGGMVLAIWSLYHFNHHPSGRW